MFEKGRGNFGHAGRPGLVGGSALQKIDKTSSYVKITEESKYSGQDMSWTENETDRGYTKEVHFLYHSSDKKINSFYPKHTAFYHSYFNGRTGENTEKIPGEKYLYELELPAGSFVRLYDSEVRVLLFPGMKIKDVTQTRINKSRTILDLERPLAGEEPDYL